MSVFGTLGHKELPWGHVDGKKIVDIPAGTILYHGSSGVWALDAKGNPVLNHAFVEGLEKGERLTKPIFLGEKEYASSYLEATRTKDILAAIVLDGAQHLVFGIRVSGASLITFEFTKRVKLIDVGDRNTLRQLIKQHGDDVRESIEATCVVRDYAASL